AYGSAKRGQSTKFAGVAEHVIGEPGGSVVLFGSEKEQPISNEIMHAIDRGMVAENTVLSLAGKTTLGDLCNLIAACDLLVTNDSGPMHIAYAVGTPLIALFGSTSPELTGPPDSSFEGAEFGYRYAVLRSGVECSPCFERTCRYGHLRCMEKITAELVIRSMQDLLPSARAVFFDRDGTLCRDVHYLNRMDDLEINPEIKSLRALKDKGYLLIGISNQSGIARGFVDEEFVRKVNRIFVEEHGFDAFYYCPHHPDDRCACRKPMNGMLLKARADFNIDFRNSFFVGDTESDMKAARLSDVEAIQITSHETEKLEHAASLINTLSECLSVIR
ncbi:MAG: HAD-IIIA family hydrolase, partial [bacterium]